MEVTAEAGPEGERETGLELSSGQTKTPGPVGSVLMSLILDQPLETRIITGAIMRAEKQPSAVRLGYCRTHSAVMFRSSFGCVRTRQPVGSVRNRDVSVKDALGALSLPEHLLNEGREE